MIYQFTHRGITKCRECPCCSFASDSLDYDICNITDSIITVWAESIPDDCPLVEVND